MRNLSIAILYLFCLSSCTHKENGPEPRRAPCDCGETEHIYFLVNNGLGFDSYDDYYGVKEIEEIPYSNHGEKKWRITICQYWNHCTEYEKIVYAIKIDYRHTE